MNVTTTVLVLTLLTCLGNIFLPGPQPKSTLAPLDEAQVEVRWVSKGDEAPFDGILMNNYTFERIRLKLIEKE